jgi:hypothetical protein
MKFKRTVARKELKFADPHWTEEEFERHYDGIEKIDLSTLEQ